jgi:hypothetical protein
MLGQHWTETTYVDEANYDFNTRNITNAHWSEIYRDVLLDLSTSKINTDANNRLSAATKNSRNANRNIKRLCWANLVETFGISLSQALPSYNIKSRWLFLTCI